MGDGQVALPRVPQHIVLLSSVVHAEEAPALLTGASALAARCTAQDLSCTLLVEPKRWLLAGSTRKGATASSFDRPRLAQQYSIGLKGSARGADKLPRPASVRRTSRPWDRKLRGGLGREK